MNMNQNYNMNQIRDFRICKYIKDKKNHYWKYRPNRMDFIKVTPWKPGEDRRLTLDEVRNGIRNGKYIQDQIALKNARTKINEIWMNTPFEWDYDGDHFMVDVVKSKKSEYYKAPIHNLNKSGWYSDWRLGFVNGQIYWVNEYHYSPRCIIIPFQGYDKYPDYTLSRWCHIRQIRPIWSVNKRAYI